MLLFFSSVDIPAPLNLMTVTVHLLLQHCSSAHCKSFIHTKIQIRCVVMTPGHTNEIRALYNGRLHSKICSTTSEKCFLVGKHFSTGSSQKLHHTSLFKYMVSLVFSCQTIYYSLIYIIW